MGKFTFQTTVIGKVFVPSLGVEVQGSCNETDGSQWISFTWGKNNVRMNFDPADKDSWTFTDLVASLSMDDLDNATAAGVYFIGDINMTLSTLDHKCMRM